jgi:hypothetical protein
VKRVFSKVVGRRRGDGKWPLSGTGGRGGDNFQRPCAGVKREFLVMLWVGEEMM